MCVTLKRITALNLNDAVRIQAELFPKESARVNYEESIDGTTDYEYYLLYEGDDCVGITGLYHSPGDRENAWLGWFGIREGARRRGLGSEALRLYEEMAAERGYRFARLYNGAVDNEVAIAFYKSNGCSGEPYSNAEDPACQEYRILIFSKALDGRELIPWGNRNIHITEQLAKEGIGMGLLRG